MKLIKYIFHITGILGIVFIIFGFIDLWLYLFYNYESLYLIKSILYFVSALFLEILNYKTGVKL